MSRITKIAVQVEYDGKPYAVLIEQEHAQLAAQLLSSFCKDHVLQLVAMPVGCSFDKLSNILQKEIV
jgi:hypothetical protein